MVLREAFAMGADEGYLICDKAFAGADVLATSYTLKQAIQSSDDYDMILCGRQTTDGDTAQVSGAIAEWMQIPRLNWVTGIDVLDEHTLGVEYCMEHRTVMAKVTLPCLMSVERDGFPPRMPSLKLKICGRKRDPSDLYGGSGRSESGTLWTEGICHKSEEDISSGADKQTGTLVYGKG